MITKTTSMNICRMEIMSECKHRQQWSISSLITKIILEYTTCHLRTTCRLCCDDLCFLAVNYIMTQKWTRDTAEVTATPKTSNNHIRIFACHLHLLLSLLSDDSLMKGYVAQDRT